MGVEAVALDDPTVRELRPAGVPADGGPPARAVALDVQPGVWALAGDTDGVDGAEEVAGAIVTPDTLARAWAKGIRPVDRLTDNDGHGFFEALGDQVITGPTLTNVNDFRAVLVLP